MRKIFKKITILALVLTLGLSNQIKAMEPKKNITPFTPFIVNNTYPTFVSNVVTNVEFRTPTSLPITTYMKINSNGSFTFTANNGGSSSFAGMNVKLFSKAGVQKKSWTASGTNTDLYNLQTALRSWVWAEGDVFYQTRTSGSQTSVNFTNGSSTTFSAANPQFNIVLTNNSSVEYNNTNTEVVAGKDIIIPVSEVANINSTLVSKSGAYIYKLADGATVPITQIDTSLVLATPGVYQTSIAANSGTSKSIKVTVTLDPVLEAYQNMIYAVGSSVTESHFRTQIHVTMNVPGTITSNFNTAVDLNTIGVYTVTLNGTDVNSFTATPITAKVHVTARNINTYPNADTAIEANNFFVDINDVPSLTEEAVINLSGANGWQLSDGTTRPVTAEFATILPINGNYTVKIITNGIHKFVTATVTGTTPLLSSNKFMVYNTNASITEAQFFLDTLTALNVPGTITSDFTTAVDFSTNGNYTVTINGADNAAHPAPPITVTVIVTDHNFSLDVGSDVFIDANDDMQLDINEVPSLTDAIYIDRAQASAWKLSDGSSLPLTVSSNVVQINGTYTVTFSNGFVSKNTSAEVVGIIPVISSYNNMAYQTGSTVNDTQFLSDVLATLNVPGNLSSNFSTVVDLNTPGIYLVQIDGDISVTPKFVNVTITDKNIVTSPTNNVVIDANNFNVHINDVPNLNNAKVLGLSKASAWQLSDGTHLTFDTIDFSSIVQTNGTYPVIFTKNNVSKTVNATVVGVIPVLSANQFMVYNLNSTVTDTQFLADANVLLNTQGVISSDFATAVNLNTAGTYTVTINAVALFLYNAPPITVTVIVPDHLVTVNTVENTVIDAIDYTADINEVPNLTPLIHTTRANATAWKLSDGTSLPLTNSSTITQANGTYVTTFTSGTVSHDVDVIVSGIIPALSSNQFMVYNLNTTVTESQFFSDTNTLLNTTGSITSNFSTAVDLNTAGTYTVTINAVDTLGNNATPITISVIVPNHFVTVNTVEDTVIDAIDYTADINEVPNLTPLIHTTRANATAWKLSDGSSLPLTNSSNITQANGTYVTTFTSGTVSHNVNVVVSGVIPALSANQFMVYNLNATVIESQFFSDTNTLLNTTGTITSNFATAVDLDTAGTYTVTINAVDNLGNSAPAITINVIVSGHFVTVNTLEDTVIDAIDYTANINEVPNLTPLIHETRANATAWKLSDGSSLPLTNSSTITQANGTYVTTFTSGTVSHDVNVVVSGIIPTLSSNQFMVYNLNTIVTESQFFSDTNTLLNTPGTITSNFATIVDLNTAGTYTVTINAVDNLGYLATPITISVIVPDHLVAVDTVNDTVIDARNYNIDLNEVPNLTPLIHQTKAQASAWKLSNGSILPLSVFSTVIQTNGTYSTTFTSGTLSHTVQAVVSGIIPALSSNQFMAYNLNSTSTDTQFLADAKVTLNTSGTITSNFNTVVDLNTAGDYIVTINAVDNLGNAASSITVSVKVYDHEVTIDIPNNTVIDAKDYTVNINEVLQVTEAQHILKASATAFSLVDGSLKPLNASSTIVQINGTYNTTFTTGLSSRTVDVIVDGVLPELSSNLFMVYHVNSIVTEESFLNDISAQLNLNGTINSNFESVVNFNIPGSYIVKIEAEGLVDSLADPKYVTVIITNRDVVVSTLKDVVIDANNFTIDINNISTLTSDKIIELANASGWKLSDGSKVILTQESSIEAIHGDYKVKFLYNGVYKEITVSVTGTLNTLLPTGFTSNNHIYLLMLSCLLFICVCRRKKIS